MEKVIGQIKVLEVVDNPDGTCTIHFDVSDEMMTSIKEAMGWKRWSDKKFNQLVIESLERFAAEVKHDKEQTTQEAVSNS